MGDRKSGFLLQDVVFKWEQLAQFCVDIDRLMSSENSRCHAVLECRMQLR